MSVPAPDWEKVARLVLLSREMDRLEVEQLTPQGKVKYQFSAGGHELAQVLLALALTHPHDAAMPYYRSRPFMLACGLTPEEAFQGGMAHCGSPSEGRDVGVVFNMPSRGGLNILPSSGDVGAQYTPVAGWAQAITYRRDELGEVDWDGAVGVSLGGEGSVAANGFWAALNVATTENVPMLFFIEDNQFGLSVPSDCQTPSGNIAANLASYGNLKIVDADGTEPLAAWEGIQEALQHVRSGLGPALLRMRVVRLAGHTFVDDQAYKSQEFRQAEQERDPLDQLRKLLIDQGMDPETWEKLIEETRREVQEAARRAEAAPQPHPDEVLKHIFYEGQQPMRGGLRPEGAVPPPGLTEPQPSGPRVNLIDAVRRTLEVEMQLNPRILVFGEDVGVKGGVHGATHGMHQKFGWRRVFDTSLSEDGIMGRAAGMALAGLLPVPEIQFRKYADPAHEQINDIGTIRWRTANHFAAPVVVRIPVGFSKKTGDPWHSVSGEAIYAHTLGWRIAYPSNAEDAVGLLRTALRGDDPTFFFEHRNLLDTPDGRRPYPGDDYCLPFGLARRLVKGNELVVVTWGAMVARCLEAAKAYSGRVMVMDLRTIIPWDRDGVLQAVRDTGKILVVHEDTRTNGFAGEILATIAQEAFHDLDAPAERLATPDIPIPYNITAMESILPSVEKIQARIDALLAY